jgi:hypothetical protein
VIFVQSKAVTCILLGTVLLCLVYVPRSRSAVDALFEDYETIINPNDYPGSTNFEKLQHALNDVPPEGAVVLLSSEIYQGSNLTVPSKVKIIGVYGSIFKLCDCAVDPFMVIRNRANVEIENVTFDGNREHITDSYASLIFIGDGCENISISNNTFTNFRNQAITSSCYDPSSHTKYIAIYRNMFYNGAGAAILLRGSYDEQTYFLEHVEVYENMLYNLTSNGKIGVAFTSNPNITNNKLVSCEASLSGSIAVRGCKDAYVAENSITSCTARAGIFIETNMIFPNTGVFVIENNRVTGQFGKGFSLSGSSGVDAEITLRRNSFSQNSGPDVETTNVRIFVYDNIVDTLEDLVLSPTTVAWGNLVRFNTGYIFIQLRAR